MAAFRFTMNVGVTAAEGLDDVLEELATLLLDRALNLQARNDRVRLARVRGDANRSKLKVLLEFEADSHNAAHNFGFAQIRSLFRSLGFDVSSWDTEPLVAKTEDDATDDGWDYDTLVEHLGRGVDIRVGTTNLEPVPA